MNYQRTILLFISLPPSLDETNNFPHDTSLYVLTGLTSCNVPKFVSPFELLLDTERVKYMNTAASIINTSQVTLARVK